jgi:predicted ATPase
VLIERAGFLASLEGLLGEALDGSGRLVFLGGEAGIGKTTLAAALADAAAGARDPARLLRQRYDR